MNGFFRRITLALALLAVHGAAMPDDTDLFVRAGATSDPPNVLFVIDNAGNFAANADGETCEIDGVPTALSGKVGGIEQCALHRVISALPVDSVRIGIMVYNDSGLMRQDGTECPVYAGDSSRPGGCLLYQLTLMTEENKPALLTWIRNWTAESRGDGADYRVDGSRKQTGGVMQEAWAYYKGRTGLSGRTYVAPPTACNNYVIFIGNSYTDSGSPGDRTNDGPRDALFGSNSVDGKNAFPPATAMQRRTITTTHPSSCPSGTDNLGLITPHENSGLYADEWARYMNDSGITTFSIGVLGDRCRKDYAALLTSMGSVGGGRYFPTYNLGELVEALQAALSEMLSVNSVFASVSLPVSVNNQGTYLNQVYIGMFRPDDLAKPRWAGNLKQYRLGLVGSELRLLDAKEPGEVAISGAGTGFLSSCARSYWTPALDDRYWQTYKRLDEAEPPRLFCAPHPAVSNTPDGNLVEKGAQGYVLRGSPTAPSISRNLTTCNAGCTSLTNFDSSNAAISKVRLGDAPPPAPSTMSDDDRVDLINWARGQNNRGDEKDPDGFQLAVATAMRPSVHGDVMHSRPLAINYGAPNDVPPLVVVFYCGNDGVLRAVNGNRTASFNTADIVGAAAPGRELWSFIAPEFYPYIGRLRNNTVPITFKNTTAPAHAPKPYGFDGPLTGYQAGGDAWLFATMRRGGRMIYAFDVSNLATAPDSSTTPRSPTLKWRLGCGDLDGDGVAGDTECTSTGIERIGQTWSSPTILKAREYYDEVTVEGVTTNVPKPMLIMGGGYDPCEDFDPHTCTAASKGNRIYVIDADTGSILRTFITDRAVVGDVTVVTDRYSGLAQWAYAADMGGNIYRISGLDAHTAISKPDEPAAPGNWTITKIASLGCGTIAACGTQDRKFMYAPDVVVEPAPDAGTHIILIGSGDREKPLLDYTHAYEVNNYFFMVKDAPTDTAWLSTNMGSCTGNVICLGALAEVAGSDAPSATALATTKGWYMGLNAHEQVVTSAVTVFGGTTFSTHTPTVPEPDACTSDLGTARVYNIRYKNAAPSKPGATNRYEEIVGGGLPPSPVAGQVILDGASEPIPFIIGADPRSPLEGSLPVAPSLSTLPKSITYWYIEK